MLSVCSKTEIPAAISYLLLSPALLTLSGWVIKLSPLFKDNPLLSVTPSYFFHSFPRDVPFHNAAAAPSRICLRAECIVDSKNVIYIYKLTDCKYKICLLRLLWLSFVFLHTDPLPAAGIHGKWLSKAELWGNEKAD